MPTEATKELKSAVAEAVDRGTGPDVSPVKAAVIAEAAVERVQDDPVAANALNQEPFWQSGVGVFGAGGVLWAVGFLLMQVSEHGTQFHAYDLEQTVGAAGTVLLFAAVLYRRFVPGLKPLFWWARRR